MNLKPFETFLDGEARNAWLRWHDCDVYVRKSRRWINGRPAWCFDLASMNADVPGRGRMTLLMPALQALVKARGFDVLFAESVVNDRLPAFLTRHGFVPVEGNPSSFAWETQSPGSYPTRDLPQDAHKAIYEAGNDQNP